MVNSLQVYLFIFETFFHFISVLLHNFNIHLICAPYSTTTTMYVCRCNNICQVVYEGGMQPASCCRQKRFAYKYRNVQSATVILCCGNFHSEKYPIPRPGIENSGLSLEDMRTWTEALGKKSIPFSTRIQWRVRC